MCVVYVRGRGAARSGLNGVRAQSLEQVFRSREPVNTVRFNGSSPDDVASITYTSGATGAPRGVMNTHQSWLAGAAFARDFRGLSNRDAIVIPSPVYGGLAFRQILAYVLTGAKIVLTRDADHALRLMKETRPSATVLASGDVGLLVERYSRLLRELAPSLRYMEIGLGPLDFTRFEALRLLLPHTRIHVPYGLAEARVGFLTPGPDRKLNRLTKIAPNVDVTVVNESRVKVPRGVTGQILLRGPGLMKGYWGQRDEEIDALRQDGFLTGDTGVMDATGVITLLGRVDGVGYEI